LSSTTVRGAPSRTLGCFLANASGLPPEESARSSRGVSSERRARRVSTVGN
jgi:hypothetical protein